MIIEVDRASPVSVYHWTNVFGAIGSVRAFRALGLSLVAASAGRTGRAARLAKIAERLHRGGIWESENRAFVSLVRMLTGGGEHVVLVSPRKYVSVADQIAGLESRLAAFSDAFYAHDHARDWEMKMASNDHMIFCGGATDCVHRKS